jgi:hypothetical protein
MKSSKLIFGIAALALLADVALADPTAQASAPISQTSEAARALASAATGKHKPRALADAQMDKVTAGELSLNFTKIEWQYVQQAPSGPPATTSPQK